MKHNGSPPPVFETDDERLSFVTILYQHPEFRSGALNGSINGSIKTLSDNKSRILDSIQKDPTVTRKIISENLGISLRTVDRAISELVANSIIERQGSKKSGIWIIK